jgi:hypothetical protein
VPPLARPSDRRTRLRAIVRYLKAQRELVQRGAGEHARWVKFIAEAASLLRASPSPYRTADGKRAHQYASLFDQYVRFMRSLTVPDYCVPLHGATSAWLESLAGLSMDVAVSIQKNDPSGLERIVRAAGEPQLKLGTAQRTRLRTLEGLKKLFEDRPKPVPKAPKPVKIPWLTAKRR